MEKVSENLRDISVVINIILWLGVIAECIFGLYMLSDELAIGIMILAVAFVTIIAILLIKSILNWMADIYDMIYDIRNGSVSGAVLNSDENPSGEEKVWICNCGKINPNKAEICEECCRTLEENYYWRCADCGEVNVDLDECCNGCGKER